MMQLLAAAAQELDQGNSLCMATIIRQSGSAPRSVGTSFMVKEDGSIVGTIGGGRLEAETMRAAAGALEEARALTLRFSLTGQEVAQLDMICGGEVEVYLEPLYSHDAQAGALLGGAAWAASQGSPALLISAVRPGPMPGVEGRWLLVTQQGEPAGGLQGAPDLANRILPRLESLWTRGRSGLTLLQANGITHNLLMRPLTSPPTVYLFGAGHVSRALASLLGLASFRLVVVDDRPEFASQERFPGADEILVRDLGQVLEGIEMGARDYAVIITRGHLFDKEVLGAVLQQNPVYVGMIGSRRKRDMIYQQLGQEGVTAERLAQVHCPIGLSIGAESPEEIAVSIAAELIAVRAGLSQE